jgi:hypothetical protein
MASSRIETRFRESQDVGAFAPGQFPHSTPGRSETSSGRKSIRLPKLARKPPASAVGMNRVIKLIPISMVDRRAEPRNSGPGSLITWCCRLGREGRPLKHQPNERAIERREPSRSLGTAPARRRDAWASVTYRGARGNVGRLAYRNAQGDHVRLS